MTVKKYASVCKDKLTKAIMIHKNKLDEHAIYHSRITLIIDLSVRKEVQMC